MRTLNEISEDVSSLDSNAVITARKIAMNKTVTIQAADPSPLLLSIVSHWSIWAQIGQPSPQQS